MIIRLLKKNWLLFLIIILAALLRFYQLGDYPALNADEAAIGYNAYSLIQTGKDEHGNPWPIHFQSFNDYKPGLYFYMVLPFVKFLGLNEWSVRIPGALAGVATVVVLYYLIKELFPDKDYLAEISALFLAISPWHIHFSRGGWEVNVATLFIVLGLWLFAKALKNPKFYFLSILSFVFSLYTYHAARIVVPLLGVGLFFIYPKRIFKKQNLKFLILNSLFLLLLLAPLVKDLTGSAGLSRAAGVGLFVDPGPLNRINEQRGEHFDYQGKFVKILHNKAVNYSLAFLQNWAAHGSGEFLFLSGDVIQRNRVPETGQLYIFEIFTLIVGFAAIAKNSKGLPAGRQGWGLILLWLIVAPTAAALTFQSPHALRAQNMVIPLTIISSFGFSKILVWFRSLKNNRLTALGNFLLIFIILWSLTRYLHMYYVHMAKEYPYSSQYGVKEMVGFVAQKSGDYQKVIVTDRYDQPYILFLFYLKYPPQKFQENHALSARDKYGFSTVRDFDKYHFETIDFSKIQPENPNSLIVGTDAEIPKEANIIRRIYFPNGQIAFKIVAN